MFAKAREQSPAVIILDEVGAICPRRDDRDEGRDVADGESGGGEMAGDVV